jgi:hypothetical protein
LEQGLEVGAIGADKEPPAKLTAVAYLYILKEEADPLAALHSFLTETYQPVDLSSSADLGLGSGVFDLDFHQKSGAGRLRVHFQSHENILTVSLLSFDDRSVDRGWAAHHKFLGDCLNTLGEDGIELLGSALMMIGEGDADRYIAEYKSAVGEPAFSDLSGTLSGRSIYQLTSNIASQHLLLTGNTSDDYFLTGELPQILWTIQRLHREKAFFEDRIKTILTEKNQAAAELSQILHQKVGKSLTADSTQALENQIERLSSMYGVLATNLHLIKEAVATFENDLAILESQAAGFQSDGGWPFHHVSGFREALQTLVKHGADVKLSLDNTKAAIGIARTQADLLRGRQGLALQEQTRQLLDQNVKMQDEHMSLSMAAHVVELVVVFYYTLKSWESIAVAKSVEVLPPIVKFSVVGMFAVSVVFLTHAIGASLHERRLLKLPVTAGALLVISSLLAMALLPGR